jgi:hypothetical protein
VAIRLDLCMTAGPPSKIRIWKLIDWKLFQENLKDLPKTPLLWNEDIIEAECNLLHNSIDGALDIACPKKVLKPSYKLPW